MTTKATGIETVLDGPEWLVMRCDIDAHPPEAVLTWFLDPAKLRQWWGEEHQIEPAFGGEYVIRWKRIDRTLRGRIVELAPTRLALSWTFDHEPDTPPRVVMIETTAVDGGTCIEIRHGPYHADDRDAAERAGHREGWEWFLPQLINAISAAI